MAQVHETELDVRALWRALWRRSWLIILLTIAVAAGTYVGLGYVDPLYTADTSILIEERESPLTRARDDTSAPSADFDESAIQSQVEVVRSREIAEAVIDKLDLTSRPEFDPARQPSLRRSLMVLLGLDENPADSTTRQRVMDSYFSRLNVYPLLQSRVIGVEFSAPDPTLAAEVANAVADAFVALQQDAKRESAVAATAWLQQEIERLRGRVAEAEQAVADYRQRSGLFDVDRSGTNIGNLSTQQLADINAELARARAARAEAEARAQLVGTLLEEGGAPDASEEVLSSQLIQRLRERQGALRAQIAELSTTLLPTHPRIRALNEQLASLDEQIRGETGKVLESLRTAARVAAAREESLLKSLNEAKGAVSESNEQGIELRALEREAAAQRELLESFLARYREASARTDANYLPPDARIISRAVPPLEPSFPKKTMMTVAAALAALLILSAIVLLAEFTSGRAFRVIGSGSAGDAPTPLRSTVPEPPSPGGPPVSRRPAEPVVSAAAEEPSLSSKLAEPVEQDEPVRLPPRVDVAEPAVEEDDIRVVPAAKQVEPDFDRHVREASDMALASELLDQTPPVLAAEIDEHVPPPSPAEPAPHTSVAEAEHEAARATDPVVAHEAPPVRAPAQERKPAQQREALPVRESAPEPDQSGTAGLAEIIASSPVRLALFAGAEGGEGAGAVAFSAARQAAKQKVRCVLVDVGRNASDALGHERPGLGDLLAGEASFGEVIQRDDTAHVHVIPMGSLDQDTPMQRMQLVIGALTHTYDKVILVADKVDDWPDEFARPDIAAIVCGADTTESLRTELYDFVLARGAQSAVIVRYRDFDLGGHEESAAA